MTTNNKETTETKIKQPERNEPNTIKHSVDGSGPRKAPAKPTPKK